MPSHSQVFAASLLMAVSAANAGSFSIADASKSMTSPDNWVFTPEMSTPEPEQHVPRRLGNNKNNKKNTGSTVIPLAENNNDSCTGNDSRAVLDTSCVSDCEMHQYAYTEMKCLIESEIFKAPSGGDINDECNPFFSALGVRGQTFCRAGNTFEECVVNFCDDTCPYQRKNPEQKTACILHNLNCCSPF